jgi:hypothetical protein
VTYTVCFDAEGYSVEDGAGHMVAYFPLDISGEGDFEVWNAQARRMAHKLCELLNAGEAW